MQAKIFREFHSEGLAGCLTSALAETRLILADHSTIPTAQLNPVIVTSVNLNVKLDSIFTVDDAADNSRINLYTWV